MINLVCYARFGISVVWKCSAPDEQAHIIGSFYFPVSSNHNSIIQCKN